MDGDGNRDRYLPVGEKTAGVEYQRRPSAYAVLRNSSGDFGLIWTGRLYFLAGGGIEAGESPEEAVIRETLEESGHSCSIVKKLGEITEYFQSREDGRFYEVVGHYFEAELGPRLGEPSEPDHELRWFPAAEALLALHRPGHIRILEQVIGTPPSR